MFTDRIGLLSSFFVLAITAAAQTTSVPAEPSLSTIKRVCIDKFAGDPSITAQAREAVIAAVFALKRFAVTDNCERADASMRGAATERQDQKVRGEGEAAAIAAGSGVATANSLGASAAVGSFATGSQENLYSAETKRQASVTLRITDKDGTVLWAHTQESPGGKAKSALNDAVERAVVQLRKDLDRAGAPK